MPWCVTELLKVSKKKQVLTLIKKSLGMHPKEQEELSNAQVVMRKAEAED